MRRYEHGGDIYGNPDVMLDFSVNTNPLGMPESVKRALSGHIADYERYPDPCCRELTAAVASQHRVEPSMVLCGNGAADLICRLCASLKPLRALTIAPTFSEYERTVTLFGGETLWFFLHEQNGFMLTDRIIERISPDIDMLFLCNPNNPTGRLADPDLLRRIADRCEANHTFLIIDECFIDFTEGESMIPLLQTHPHLMILRAFTKLYAMAGLRLGYLLCADSTLLSEIGRFGPMWNVSVPAQTAGLAALRETGWVEKTRRLVHEERTFMVQALSSMALCVSPGDANFLLVKSSVPLYEPLLRRDILVRNCANFPRLSEKYFRIGLKQKNQNEALVHALSEVLYG